MAITPEQARAEIARREAARIGQPEKAGQLAQQGFVRTRPPVQERFKGTVVGNLPEIMQGVGGVGGAIAGAVSPLKAPVRGQIAGGTAGRVLGELIQKSLQGEFKNASLTKKKEAGIEILQAGGTALATESLFGGIGKVAALGGEGMLKGLLGPRVAERGIERGFKGLLDPKFFQNRVPKEIATKVSKFFSRLDNTVGGKSKRAILSKSRQQGKIISTKEIKDGQAQILKDIGAESVDDLSSITTSTAQKNKLKSVETLINRTGDKVSLNSLWKIQRKIDEVAFKSGALSDEAKRYLVGLRSLTSNKIKRFGGKEVNKQFGRYSLVQQQKQTIRNNFDAMILSGQGSGADDVFAPKIEQFANNILGTNKDEVVRGLAELDTFLDIPGERIVEDLLDVAAAEQFSKNIELMGLFSRGALGTVGGRKFIAGIGAKAQEPGVRALGSLLQAGAATGTTSGLQGQQ